MADDLDLSGYGITTAPSSGRGSAPIGDLDLSGYGISEPVSRTPKPRKKKKGKKSVGGFLGNLLEDAGETAIGLGPGLLSAGKAVVLDAVGVGPRAYFSVGRGLATGEWDYLGGSETKEKIVEPMVESYKQMYGPLFRGDLGQFAENVYEHPLGPILDALTVASAGVGGAAKAGVVGKAGRSLELTAPSGAKLTRAVTGSELSRRLKLAADKTLKQLPPEFRVLGEYSRYSRQIAYKNLRTQIGLKLAPGKYNAAIGKLSKEEFVAMRLLCDFPTRKLLDEERARLARTGVPSPMMDDPKVLALVDAPTKKIEQALYEAEQLTGKQAALLIGGEVKKGGKKGTVPALTEEAAEIRRYQPILIARGARYVPDPEELERAVRRLGLTGENGVSGVAPGALVKAADRQNYGRVVSIGGDKSRVHFVNRAEGSEATVELPTASLSAVPVVETSLGAIPRSIAQRLTQRLEAPEGQSIRGMIDEISSEIAQEGRWQPIYHPQKMIEENRGNYVGVGGRAPQRNPVQKNRAILQTMGRVAYDIDALSPAFMRTAKWAVYVDRHNDLATAGKFVSPEDASALIATGKYEYVKRNLAEKIPATERMGGEFDSRLAEWFPEGAEGAEELVTKIGDAAVTDAAGNRLVVPKAMSDRIVGEYVRSSNALTWFWTKPTDVWRALVLNLRIGWLTNNVVGNTLLYAIRNAGPRGLTAYLQAMSDIAGPQAVRRLLLRDKEVLNRLILDDAIDVFPEQVAGTFFGTQGLDTGTSRLARAGQKAAKYTTQPLRRADIAIEQRIRLAMINNLVKKSPEFKKVYKEMPAKTRSIRAAEIKLLKQDRQFAERVSREVNDALGDYLSLSHFERTALRGVAPFYAWYRAISLVTLKMPLDVPGRTNLLTKLGQAGWDESVAQLGPDGIEDYLRALFLFDKPKGGKVKALSTQGMNPFLTVKQEAEAAQALAKLMRASYFGGEPPSSTEMRSGVGMINPFVGGLLARSSGASKQSVFENLPQIRLAKALAGEESSPNATYEKTPLSEILAFLGFPVKDVNLNNARANYYRYRGR
ncbi:MAG: hypothetical protein WC565_02915 [Parcubacteria group bacterium]